MTRGCAYHTINRPDCLYCRATGDYDADIVAWMDYCPHCESRDLRYNLAAQPAYTWCGKCGKQNR